MNLFHFCKIKNRNLNFFSSRENMVRQKARKTVENLYKGVPPSGPLAATARFDDIFVQNSQNNTNEKTAEKANICIHDSVTCRKKSISRNPATKKDHKTFANKEMVLKKSEKTETVHHTKNHFNEENEKDEDTEEFFGMIKETVERVVEKLLQDMVARSFKEIRLKLDEIREKLYANENALNKIQTDIISKIIHYGEENSRHFRYLCMKSEYDKMFYQHQNIIPTFHVDTKPNVINEYKQHLTHPIDPLAQGIHQTKPTQQSIQLPANCLSNPKKSSTMPMICNCHSKGYPDFDCAQRSKLRSVSSKSSDMGIREVKDLLQQLQKFYDQNNFEKDNQKDELENEPLNVPDQDDSADGDEDDESSDEMTSPSIEENIGAGGDS